MAELVTGKSRIGIQAVGTVELYFVIDFAMQQLFNGDPTRIIEYLALYVKSVRNIFATNDDPTLHSRW